MVCPPSPLRARGYADSFAIMNEANDRDAAWDALHEALPARWIVGLPSRHPSTGVWSITAIGPHPGRGKIPQTVTGAEDDEIAALRDLDDRLRGVPQPDGSQMDELRRQWLLRSDTRTGSALAPSRHLPRERSATPSAAFVPRRS